MENNVFTIARIVPTKPGDPDISCFISQSDDADHLHEMIDTIGDVVEKWLGDISRTLYVDPVAERQSADIVEYIKQHPNMADKFSSSDILYILNSLNKDGELIDYVDDVYPAIRNYLASFYYMLRSSISFLAEFSTPFKNDDGNSVCIHTCHIQDADKEIAVSGMRFGPHEVKILTGIENWPDNLDLFIDMSIIIYKVSPPVIQTFLNHCIENPNETVS